MHLVSEYEKFFDGNLGAVHLSFKQHQTIYDELRQKLVAKNIPFAMSKTLELPMQLSSLMPEKPSPPTEITLWIIDDFANEIFDSDSFAAELNTLRHRGVQVILLLHRVFSNTAAARSISNNLSLFFFTPARRQLLAVKCLATQLGLGAPMVEAFMHVCSHPRHQYLLVDAQPQCPDQIRLRARPYRDPLTKLLIPVAFVAPTVFNADDAQDDDMEEKS